MAATVGPALFPGATTFPDTTVFPGQGNIPLHRVMVSHSDYSVSPPVWTDYSSRARSITVSRGRNSELDNFDAGSASVVLDNRDRTLDPFINAAVRPMNKVWIYAEFSGDRRDLFQGYAEAWQESWDRSGTVDAVTTLRATDESKVLNLKLLPSSGSASSAVVQQVLIAILDAVGNRAPRSFQGGTSQAANYVSTWTGQQALAELQTFGIADFAAGTSNATDSTLFVAATGTITFLAANHRSNAPYDTAQSTFGDAGGSELPYLDCQLDYSDSFLFNTWTTTGLSSSSQTSSDATSVASYGTRASSRSYPIDLTSLANVAAKLVAKYKDPFQRVVTVKPNMADANTCQQVLARELMDRIRLLRTPPGGGARIDEQLFIQRVDYAATPGVPPDCQIGVSPL